MYEAGPVETVGMHMVGQGESADWLEYVLVVGKAKKKKVFILLRSTEKVKFQLKRNDVFD